MSNKLNKNRKNGFLEMTLKHFLEVCPEFKAQVPREVNINDPFYMVRVYVRNYDIVAIELGYPTDNWLLG